MPDTYAVKACAVARGRDRSVQRQPQKRPNSSDAAIVPPAVPRARTIALSALALVFLTGICGCHALMDHCEDKALWLKDRMAAERAWKEWRPIYSDLDCQSDFGGGFKDGYASVAGGGSGCLPTLPPRKYWGVHYQSPKGQQRSMAWFDGFAHGAAAAQMDGVAAWNRIMISPTVQQAHRMRAAVHKVHLPPVAVPEALPAVPGEFPVEPAPMIPPAPEALDLDAGQDALEGLDALDDLSSATPVWKKHPSGNPAAVRLDFDGPGATPNW